jgi:hypothetical protein
MEFDCLCVFLFRLVRLLDQLPVVAPKQVFHHAQVHGFFLVVANVNLERFVHPALA